MLKNKSSFLFLPLILGISNICLGSEASGTQISFATTLLRSKAALLAVALPLAACYYTYKKKKDFNNTEQILKDNLKSAQQAYKQEALKLGRRPPVPGPLFSMNIGPDTPPSLRKLYVEVDVAQTLRDYPTDPDPTVLNCLIVSAATIASALILHKL